MAPIYFIRQLRARSRSRTGPLGAVAHTGLREHAVKVSFHRRLGEKEPPADLLVPKHLADEREYLGLARGEVFGQRRRQRLEHLGAPSLSELTRRACGGVSSQVRPLWTASSDSSPCLSRG